MIDRESKHFTGVCIKFKENRVDFMNNQLFDENAAPYVETAKAIVSSYSSVS